MVSSSVCLGGEFSKKKKKTGGSLPLSLSFQSLCKLCCIHAWVWDRFLLHPYEQPRHALRQSVVRTDSGCDSRERERVLGVVVLEQTSSRPPSSSSSSCDHVFTSSREAVLEELLLLLIRC